MRNHSSKNKRRVSSKLGMPPGSLVHIGEPKTDNSYISAFYYNAQHCEEQQGIGIEKIVGNRSKPGITWLNIDGLHDTALVERIGKAFGISSLTLEDILNTHQRPKLDEYGNYVYVVVKMLHYPTGTDELEIEQVSFLLGNNFLLSFQEGPGDTFDFVRTRLQLDNSALRLNGTDYLLYALLDTIVDNYFVIMERLSSRTEDLEEQLLNNPDEKLLTDIYWLKKEISRIRRSVYPLREVIATLDRNESKLMTPNTKWYIRDVYDHTVQVIESIENFRDITATMIDLYLSGISHRMNSIMKALTIMSSIFIPLTFIAGVYGMNFEHMPELKWTYGYFGVLAAMFFIALAIIWYMKRKKWL